MKKCFRAAHGSIFLLKSAENYVMLSLLLKGGGALQTTAGGSALTSEGGEYVPITLTFHLFGLTFTIRVKK